MQKLAWFTGRWHGDADSGASVQEQFRNWLEARQEERPKVRVVSHAMCDVYKGKGLEGRVGTITVVYEEEP